MFCETNPLDLTPRARWVGGSEENGGYRHFDELSDPADSLANLNAVLRERMLAHNRTVERGNMDAYKSQSGRATGDYSFLTGVADDVDACIHNHSDFQIAVRKQVEAGTSFWSDGPIIGPHNGPFVHSSIHSFIHSFELRRLM